MEQSTIKRSDSVGKEVLTKLGNESLAIIGVVIIALASIFMLGAVAETIVAALGGGLVGYLTRQFS